RAYTAVLLAAASVLAGGRCVAQVAPLPFGDAACAISNTVPALTGNLLRGGELKIVAAVDPADGHGELAAYAFDASSGSFKADATWKVAGSMGQSTPIVEGPPRAGYFGAPFAGYAEFAGAWAQRKPLVWVGASDGTLHAFDAAS